METLLENGGQKLAHDGSLALVEGEQALLQRACLRLTLRRGSLPGVPDFGSRLWSLGKSGEHLEAAALEAAREALAPMKELSVVEVKASRREGKLGLRVLLRRVKDGKSWEVLL